MSKPSLDVFHTTFAQNVANLRYLWDLPNGGKETWAQLAKRVTKAVFSAIPEAPQDLKDRVEKAIANREFIPGGRYLYASGRALHQVQNCVLMRVDDSREGWAHLSYNSMMALMTGAGIGAVYSDLREKDSLIRKTGGKASGPVSLMKIINESGREVMQGGQRRSAIWAGLHWWHPDIMEFVHVKDWSPEVRALKAKDFNFPATLDMTNVSVILDDEFFEAYDSPKHPRHSLAKNVFWETLRQGLKKGEPGFSIDVGANAGENLRNAPVCGETMVLTKYRGYEHVFNLLDQPTTVWTGKQWAEGVVFKETSPAAPIVRVSMTGGRTIRCDRTHPFFVERYEGKGDKRKLVTVEKVSAADLEPGDILHVSLPEAPQPTFETEKWCNEGDILVLRTPDRDLYTVGYVYGDGTFGNDGASAEITFCTPESKSCGRFISESPRVSSVNQSDARGYMRLYLKSDREFWGKWGGHKSMMPDALYRATPEQVGSFLAGLFDADGNWEPNQKRLRLSSIYESFLRDVARLLERHGILAGVSKAGNSTYGQKQTYQMVVMSEHMPKFMRLVPTLRLRPDLDGYDPYRRAAIKVVDVEDDGIEAVYCADVGVPEHSFQAEGVIVSNCTEVTSSDTDDICNLGSINVSKVRDLDHMRELVDIGTAFLLAGTVYSDVPYAAIDKVRTKNRRLGLGVMGLHEWLLKHGKKYGPDAELGEYLKVYATSTEVAHRWAKEWKLSKPKKTRAIAPNGTIGIVSETTGGIEPLFCVAYKRRYYKGKLVSYEYVIDPVAKRLIEQGVKPEFIEDAYSLAQNVECRVEFQAWVQQYVDHGISSTINLPPWGSEFNNEKTVHPFGNMLLKYLPKLRGVTMYPDGARDGQPLTVVSYATAMAHVGRVFEEQADLCDITGKGGSCGA